jgi:hypothetical protein
MIWCTEFLNSMLVGSRSELDAEIKFREWGATTINAFLHLIDVGTGPNSIHVSNPEIDRFAQMILTTVEQFLGPGDEGIEEILYGILEKALELD